ncbi:MAG: hypothetical protein ACRCTX_09325, partial [Afipia sp.]
KVDAIRQKALAWQKSVTRKAFVESWLIEGHLHVMFVLGELMRRRQIALDKAEDGIGLIDDAVAIVERFVRCNEKFAAYRLFRSTSSRDSILQIMDGLIEPSANNPQQLLLGI